MHGFIWASDNTTCPCCGGGQVEPVLSSPDRLLLGQKGYSLGECPACKTVYLLSDGDWSVGEAYGEGYYEGLDTRRVTWFHRLIPSYFFPGVPRGAKGPIVDMGCGTGLLVEYLARSHEQVRGIEMDAATVAWARGIGRNIEAGDWESYRPDPGTVGVLIMNQVIEHLLMPPPEVFTKAWDLLTDGGYWVARTPNGAAWGRGHFGSHWHPLEVPRHTIVYSAEGIRRLAERSGFVVEGIRYCGRAYDFLQSAAYRRRDGLGGALERALALPGGSLLARGLAFLMNVSGRGDVMEVCLRKVPKT